MSATSDLISGLAQGRQWSAMGDSEAVRALLGRVYDERYHRAPYHKERFQVRVANAAARDREHVLVVDEIDRADLARVLGEAVVLFEVGETTRRVRLPHAPAGHEAELQLSPHLLVQGIHRESRRSAGAHLV